MSLLPHNATICLPSVVCFEIFQRHVHRGESRLSVRCLFSESLNANCALEVRLHGHSLAFQEEATVAVGDVVTVVFGPGVAGQSRTGRHVDTRASVRITIAATLRLRPEVQFEESVHGHTVHRTTSTTTSIFHREAHALRLLADELARGSSPQDSSSGGTEPKRTRREVARGSTDANVSVAEGGASTHEPRSERPTLVADTTAAVRHLQRSRPQKQIPLQSRSGPSSHHHHHQQQQQDAIRSSSPALPVDALSTTQQRKQKRALTSAMFRNASTARLLSSGTVAAKSAGLGLSSTSHGVLPAGPTKRKASVGDASGAASSKSTPGVLQSAKSGFDGASESLQAKNRNLGRTVSSESPVVNNVGVVSAAAAATQPTAANERKRKVSMGPAERAFAFFEAFIALWCQPMCSLAATEGLLCDALPLKQLRRACGVDAERNLLRALDMTNGKFYSRLLKSTGRSGGTYRNSDDNAGPASHSRAQLDGLAAQRAVPGQTSNVLCLADLQPTLLGKRLAVDGGLTAIRSMVPAFAAPDTGILFHYLQSCG